MPKVYVSVGSNVNRERAITRALELLRDRFGELELSSVYETEPVGFEGDPFFNMVVAFDSQDAPHAIVAALHQIEHRCGRHRGEKRFGPRTMDLDLLMVGEHVVRDDGIVLPREEICSQAFILCPLAEIAGERRHPVSGDTLAEIWSRVEKRTGRPRKVHLSVDADVGN